MKGTSVTRMRVALLELSSCQTTGFGDATESLRRVWKGLRQLLGETEPLRKVESRTRLDRLRAGDRDAFHELVLELGGALLGYACRWLARHQAEDALQDAWLDLFRKASEIPAALKPENIRQHCFGFLRIAVRRALAKSTITERLEDHPEPETEGLQELQAIATEEHGRVISALEKLNPLQQDTVLGLLDGQTPADLARELGIDVAHLRVCKSRALESLRASLAESGE